MFLYMFLPIAHDVPDKRNPEASRTFLVKNRETRHLDRPSYRASEGWSESEEEIPLVADPASPPCPASRRARLNHRMSST